MRIRLAAVFERLGALGRPTCPQCGGQVSLVDEALVGGFPPLLESTYRCDVCAVVHERRRVLEALD